MATDNIRVLIVDDSALMRAILGNHIAAAPGMSVLGVARNGREALAAVPRLRPDVVTLDLRMPDMDGLTVLDAILDRAPIPVVMVSALTRVGAAVTLDALDRGATDYVPKPEHSSEGRKAFAEELVQKIRAAAVTDVGRLIARRRRRHVGRRQTASARPIAKAAADACPPDLAGCCVALGISTGGPPALTRLLETLRPPLPPMVIVQHMPPQLTGPLAARLDALSGLTVREAAHGDRLQPNMVLIAPGGRHLKLRDRRTHVAVEIFDGPAVSSHKPSIDVMMQSAADVFGPRCLGVIMTGMGHDGVEGCRAIAAAGGFVLGQDEATSDVYGMNRAAYVAGHVNQQFSLPEAAAVIARQVRRLGCPVATA
jgi:two-component system, chemotaxis family, protein-glutamate methylesterase/glutaminase